MLREMLHYMLLVKVMLQHSYNCNSSGNSCTCRYETFRIDGSGIGIMSISLLSVNFRLNCFFNVRLRLVVTKLGVSDVRARGYKVTECIFNICIN